MTRREPRIPRFMAYPPRYKAPRPDSAYRDALIVAAAILFLISCWWIAPLLPVWPVR